MLFPPKIHVAFVGHLGSSPCREVGIGETSLAPLDTYVWCTF